MLSAREEAWRIYQSIPMPTPNDEEWRRTDIRPLRLNQIVPFQAETPKPLANAGDLPAWLKKKVVTDTDAGGWLINRDGSAVHRQLADALAEKGVVFTDLETAVYDHSDLVKEHFMTTAVPPETSKFAALHGAFWTGGTFLYVPKNVEVEVPLYGLTYQSSAERNSLGHVLIVADEGSSVTFVDESDSPTSPDSPQALHAGVVEIHLKEAALVRYIGLQDWGRNVWNFSVERAVMARDSVMQWYLAAFGSHLTKANLEVTLNGPGASAELVGLMFLDKDQHMDHRTYQNHISGLTGSDLLFKAALLDEARSVYQGTIEIHKDAQRSDAYQQNRNLLLSKQARADSIPALEIEANDVRCTHGATAGPVDDEYIFYLMARGIPHHEAERLVVDGFFQEVIQRFPVEPVVERLLATTAQKFETV